MGGSFIRHSLPIYATGSAALLTAAKSGHLYFKLKDGVVQASAYLPQRDAVKHHRMPISQVFQIEDGQISTDKELKIAFFDASKITDAFKQFDYDAISAEIKSFLINLSIDLLLFLIFSFALPLY